MALDQGDMVGIGVSVIRLGARALCLASPSDSFSGLGVIDLAARTRVRPGSRTIRETAGARAPHVSGVEDPELDQARRARFSQLRHDPVVECLDPQWGQGRSAGYLTQLSAEDHRGTVVVDAVG